MKTARTIGGVVTEFPRSTFKSTPRARHASTVNPICSPDWCPDLAPPDPTPPPYGSSNGGYFVEYTAATPDAQRIAATRHTPCYQQFSTNHYPGGVTMSALSPTTWHLEYTPGYPYFVGGVDSADISTAVRLVDNSLITSSWQQLNPNGQLAMTTYSYAGGGVATVKYAAITVIDHVYPGDNVIMGQANVICSGDPGSINGLAPIPPPVQPPPGGYRNTEVTLQ